MSSTNRQFDITGPPFLHAPVIIYSSGCPWPGNPGYARAHRGVAPYARGRAGEPAARGAPRLLR
jgi:hypothetical protein